ncbi:DMT family transporter [Mesorhizobium sp. CAU 1741]|uniref:DMT family transporter n=1 Tax=Mesorhizobium sp. CAU 1741 TaxID=3140366 RepID=UPI00325B7C09
MPNDNSSRQRLAYLVMLVAPLFFATNLVFGRGVVSEVSPFTLALIRWLAVAAALSPFIYAERMKLRVVVQRRWGLLLALAFLAMWVCGGGVYFGLQWTTATNATLIYTTSPVIILVLEGIFRGRPVRLREGAGAVIAFLGVATIVLRGDPAALFSLSFNVGDLVLVAAAFAWAGYSILYRSPELQQVSNAAMLGLLAALGAGLLLPAAAVEWIMGARLPITAQAWSGIAGIVVFASLLAFMTFQYGIRQLGAPLAGVFMYLLPPYGVVLAALLLGERFEPFHAAGIALVMGGVILATFPARRNL